MWKGNVVAISITGEGSAPMQSVEQVKAIAGQGLEGDRYCSKNGSFSDNANTTGRQVTLIESEAIDAAVRDYKAEVEYKDTRRNIVTRGVPLNHLIGEEFQVGEVRMRGVRLNEPCSHLAGLTSDKVKAGLVHRGGLRADILNDGTIRVGDAIEG